MTKTINFIPNGDRVLVEPQAAENMTSGGIVLPDRAKEPPLRGTVLAVGPGQRTPDGKFLAVPYPVGSTVLYVKYAGHEIELDEGKFLILGTHEVLGHIHAGD